MRSRVMPIEPIERSQRSPQLPEVTSVQDGVTKHGSTPSAAATFTAVSTSNPETSRAVSWFVAHFVSTRRVAPFTAND